MPNHVPMHTAPAAEPARRNAQRLVDDLQRVLQLEIETGQLTLNLPEGRLESFETRTYDKVKHDDAQGTGPNKT